MLPKVLKHAREIDERYPSNWILNAIMIFPWHTAIIRCPSTQCEGRETAKEDLTWARRLPVAQDSVHTYATSNHAFTTRRCHEEGVLLWQCQQVTGNGEMADPFHSFKQVRKLLFSFLKRVLVDRTLNGLYQMWSSSKHAFVLYHGT